MSKTKEVGVMLQKKIVLYINNYEFDLSEKARVGTRVISSAHLEKLKEISSYRQIERDVSELNSLREECKNEINILKSKYKSKRNELIQKYQEDICWRVEKERYNHHNDDLGPTVQVSESDMIGRVLGSIENLSPWRSYSFVIKDYCEKTIEKIHECNLKSEAREILIDFHKNMPLFHGSDEIKETIDELLRTAINRKPKEPVEMEDD
jgi:hypothetical protein